MRTRGIATLFFLMIICVPLIAFAEDDPDVTRETDNETCFHMWEFYHIKAINNEQHGDLYQCEICGDTMFENKENHNWSDYPREDMEYDENYHYLVYECEDCDATKIVKEKHDKLIMSASRINSTYHYGKFECVVCGAISEGKEKHDFLYDYSKKINGSYHKNYYECLDCGEIKTVKKKHGYASYLDKIIRKATLTKKAKIKRYCGSECGHYKYIYKKWNYKDAAEYHPEYSRSYWCKHSEVTKNTRYVRVKMDTAQKGAVVKLKIGKKTYKKKLKSSKNKTFKIKIKKPKFKQKVSIKVYYKKKLVGYDYDSVNVVTPGKRVKVGMTKAEVKYLWGRPDHTSSASGGWSIWYYDDGSYVSFRKGKVKNWYDAEG